MLGTILVRVHGHTKQKVFSFFVLFLAEELNYEVELGL